VQKLHFCTAEKSENLQKLHFCTAEKSENRSFGISGIFALAKNAIFALRKAEMQDKGCLKINLLQNRGIAGLKK
jgi:hypothetical protein